MAERTLSPQTLTVLASLVPDPSQWRHGYELAKQTGLKSGTLYPILIRLADRGLIEASWENEQPAGRPRRHRYRLTADGLHMARDVIARKPTAPARSVGAPKRRLAGELG